MAKVEVYHGSYGITAVSASNDIDLDGIISAADAVSGTNDEFSALSNSIGNISANFTPEALYCDGCTVPDNIEEVRNGITTYVGRIDAALESIKSAAEAKYNELQEKYNADAKQREQAEAARRAALKSNSN